MKRQQVISSLFFKFAERLAVKGLGLVIGIILARLLAPEEFGQIAIIMVFIDLSQTLIQSGLNTALIQNKTADDTDYSTVFFISLAIAVALITILYICTPFIAAYYGNNALIMPLRIYSMSLIFAAFNSVQVAKAQREMRFREMMVCSLIATMLSGAIGIGMAIANNGIWSLIAYYFSNMAISCLAMSYVARWSPKITFSVPRAKELFGYGWKMLVSGILCSIYNDIRSLIIGKRFSTEDLGYYSRAQQFPDVIANTLDSAIQSVMFPVLASVQDEKEQVKAILKKSVTIGTLIIMPAMIGLAAIAEPLIRLLLTEKWIPCVPFLQIICVGNAVLPIASSNLIAIKALGRSDVYMKLELYRRIAMVAVLLVSVFGLRTVEAIAWGYAVSAWIDVLIIGVPIKKLLGYGIGAQIQDIWGIMVMSIVMGILVMLIGMVEFPIFAKFSIQIILGGVVYVVMCKTFKITSFNYVISIVRNLR